VSTSLVFFFRESSSQTNTDWQLNKSVKRKKDTFCLLCNHLFFHESERIREASSQEDTFCFSSFLSLSLEHHSIFVVVWCVSLSYTRVISVAFFLTIFLVPSLIRLSLDMREIEQRWQAMTVTHDITVRERKCL
jgi:hypothetical protein